MSEIKVILVDDHIVVRDGIKALINSMQNVKVIAEASNEKEFYTQLKLNSPDVVVMDISLTGKSGIEITRDLRQTRPEIHVLILSMYTSEDFIFNALKAGAKGYLPKNTSRAELQNGIIEVSRGNEYFSEPISNIILKSYINRAKEQDENEASKTELSQRENEVLKLFAESKTNKEISEALNISCRTVESHKTHIMQKLKLKTTVDLIKFAIRRGIIEI